MLVLILSILALFVGVGIYPIIKSRPSLISFFDAFVLISVIGLTLLHLIPHSVEGSGLWGVLAVCIGFGVPVMLHKLPHGHDDNADNKISQVLLFVALTGIITHTLLDGIGLSMGHVHDAEPSSSLMLGLGVLFHRLPVGLFLGMMLIPRMGYARATGIAAAMAAATVLGFVLGHFALPMASLTLLNVVQGLIAGTLLHVIFHNVTLQGRSESPWPKGIGALVGIAVLALIEILMPAHEHTHASVLETWIQYLFQAAPIWCAFAAVLGIAYAVKQHAIKAENHEHHHEHSHAHHQETSKSKRIAQFVCQLLDPQPMPALYGNQIHVFSAAGIVTLVTLFEFWPAVSWWGMALLCIAIFKFTHRNLLVCASCRPESLCNQHKSFGLWMASSWTQVACIMLIAAVLPSLLTPLAEFLTHLAQPVALGMLAIICCLTLILALKKRGLPLLPCLFGAFGTLMIFAEIPYAQIFIGLTSIALLCLYDYHPREVHEAVDADTPWRRRYLTASVICIAICLTACFVPHHNWISAHPHALAHFEMHAHAHDDKHTQSMTVQILDESQHTPQEVVHTSNKILHDPHAETEHAHVLHKHTLEHDHTVYLWTRLPFLLIFMLCGLTYLLRLGPRQLFETAMGKHHHDHG